MEKRRSFVPMLASRKKSPFQVAAKRLEINENIIRARFDKTFSGSEVMPLIIAQLSPKPPIRERRSNTICAVVEWPDHHCGDDLVVPGQRARRSAANAGRNDIGTTQHAAFCQPQQLR